LAERSLEPVVGGWFRWDRRVLATEPVDPFAFLGDVHCPVQVLAGAESDVMPPASAERFAQAIRTRRSS
jgi:pimeloyl-ACP methyl ester carboxylesterase